MENCSPNRKKEYYKANTCYSLQSIKKIVSVYNKYNPNSYINPNQSVKQLVLELKKKIHENEMLWKNIPDLNDDEIENYTFKPVRSGKLLNNNDLNKVIKQYEKIYNFKYLGSVPSDIYKKEISILYFKTSIKNITINKPMILILNTEKYGKDGEHWVCIYIDPIKKYIEYFDSFGENPNQNISKVLNIFKTILLADIKINTIQYQPFTDTNCGIYILNFIKKKLKNKQISKKIKNNFFI